jgi:hypothetical protein
VTCSLAAAARPLPARAESDLRMRAQREDGDDRTRDMQAGAYTRSDISST